MQTFHIILINIDGQIIAKGDMPFVPRIGEQVISNERTFNVKNVIYDFGRDKQTLPINVAVRVEPM